MSICELNYQQRPLKEWILKVSSGNLALPKFQRSYVWDNAKIKDLLDALLRGRPVGTLLLIPYNPDQFAFRLIEGVNQIGRDDGSVELVLDGQQRLTALWGAFKKDPELFVKVQNWKDNPLKLEEIWTQSDAGINRRKNASSPKALYEKRCFPFDILGVESAMQDEPIGWGWCNSAMNNDGKSAMELWQKINRDFGEPLRNRGIWHLTLPSDMTREEAIDVYVKTNQSSAIIKKFDLAVALYDADTGKSLREEIVNMVEELVEEGALIRRFFGVGNDDIIPELGELLLKVSCLWAGLAPTEGKYTDEKVLSILRSRTRDFRDALVWALTFFTQEGIPESRYVPSDVPLRVLPALYPYAGVGVPPRHAAKVTRVVRAYLWCAFLTDRYSKSANTRLHEDYRGLIDALQNPASLSETRLEGLAPIFDKSQYPLLGYGELCSFDKPLVRPTYRNVRSRAVFAISLQQARDFGTGQPVILRPGGVGGTAWHYHHLFPKAYLKSNGDFSPREINHCLNFALITNETNRVIGKQAPHQYLASNSELASLARGERGRELKALVETHRIPFKELASVPKIHESGNVDVKRTYISFIKARSRVIEKAIKRLVGGAAI